MKTGLHISLVALLCVGVSVAVHAGGNVAANTPGGAGALNQGLQAIPLNLPTFMLMEVAQVASKVSSDPGIKAVSSATTTYQIVPTPTGLSGPVQVCLSYNSVGADKKALAVNLAANVAQMIKQLKDKQGKPSYVVAPGDPYDDVKNVRYCVLTNPA